jgi:SAM-dependent methyltransferase
MAFTETGPKGIARPDVPSITASTKRLIPAFNQTLVEGSVLNHTAASNYGTKHSLQSTAAAAYSAVVLAHSITGLKVNAGEVNPNNVDYASPLEIPNVTSYLVVGASNQGAFTNLRGGTDQPLDSGLQFYTRKAYSGSSGDTIKILTGLIRASGSTKNGECNPCRLGNQFANCSSDVVAVVGDMTKFQFDEPFDAAINSINTFRHLETEEAALAHLDCVAEHLKPGGVFILSLHLLPVDGDLWGTERWAAKEDDLSVYYALTVVETSMKTRLEKLRISMLVKNKKESFRLSDHISLRIYTAPQLKSLIAKSKKLKLIAVHDFWYDIESTQKLNGEAVDSILILQRV